MKEKCKNISNYLNKIDEFIEEKGILQFAFGGLIGIIFGTIFYLSI